MASKGNIGYTLEHGFNTFAVVKTGATVSAIADGASETIQIVDSRVNLGDYVLGVAVNSGFTGLADLAITASIPAASTVQIQLTNSCGTAITVTSTATFRVLILRRV